MKSLFYKKIKRSLRSLYNVCHIYVYYRELFMQFVFLMYILIKLKLKINFHSRLQITKNIKTYSIFTRYCQKSSQPDSLN
jgi:hypothetical protein